MSISHHQVQEIALLLQRHCNVGQESLAELQSRVWEILRRGTYRLRYDTQERLIGYCDYDLTEDGMLHVRKIIGLRPGVLRSMVSDVKHSLPWKRVFFYRAKYRIWRHYGRARRIAYAMG